MSDPTYTADGFQLAACRSCGDAVIWAATVKGKSMPVDAEPSEDGNVEVQRFPDGRVFADVLAQPPLGGTVLLRTSHFATCRDAASWRKP